MLLENILIRARAEEEFEIRVIDFGLSFKNEQIGTLSDNCGTLIYMAPEVAFNRQYQRVTHTEYYIEKS